MFLKEPVFKMGRNTSLLIVLALNVFISIYNAEGALCSNEVVETEATICPGAGAQMSANVSRNLETIKDLAWVLTPRKYSVTNGNQFTFRSIYECLSGKCASDQSTLEMLRTSIHFTLDDMTISIEDGSKYIQMICYPEAVTVQGLWNVITSTLKVLPVLDFESITEALNQIVNLQPLLPTLIQEFGRFKCHPHPLCKVPLLDTPYCSAGTRPDYLLNWRSVISWTDHISDTDLTGNAFILSSCINQKGSWTVLSIPSLQGEDNANDFKAVATNQSFNAGYFTWQNFNVLPPVEQRIQFQSK